MCYNDAPGQESSSFQDRVDAAERFIGRSFNVEEIQKYMDLGDASEGDANKVWVYSPQQWEEAQERADERVSDWLRTLVPCECGSEKAKLPFNSSWCKKYKD